MVNELIIFDLWLAVSFEPKVVLRCCKYKTKKQLTNHAVLFLRRWVSHFGVLQRSAEEMRIR